MCYTSRAYSITKLNSYVPYKSHHNHTLSYHHIINNNNYETINQTQTIFLFHKLSSSRRLTEGHLWPKQSNIRKLMKTTQQKITLNLHIKHPNTQPYDKTLKLFPKRGNLTKHTQGQPLHERSMDQNRYWDYQR